MTKPRKKRARRPLHVKHDHAGEGGTWKVETIDDTWGAMPSGSEEGRPGVLLSCCHADPDATESTLALLVDDLDALIDSLVEARATLTKRHSLTPSRFG